MGSTRSREIDMLKRLESQLVGLVLPFFCVAICGSGAWGAAEYSDETASRLPPIEDDTRRVAFADFDGDGDTDIFVVNTGALDEGIDRLLLNQNGSFTDATLERFPEETISRYGTSCLVWDIEPDGDSDILVTNTLNGRIRLFLNFDGYFVVDDPTSPNRRLPEMRGYLDACALDLEGDGDLDLVLLPVTGRARVMMNVGSGYFADTTETWIPFSWGGANSAVIPGDWDGDQLEDLFFPEGGGQSRLLMNSGSVFQDVSSTNLPDTQPGTRAATSDVDRDGDLDLVVADDGEQACRILVNDGAGVFSDESADRLPPVTTASLDILLCDVDGDGDDDIVLTDLGELGVGAPPAYLDNDGTGHFQNGSSWLSLFDAEQYCVAAADLTGDALPELLVGCGGFGPPDFPSRQNRLLVNQGAGAGEPSVVLPGLSLATPSPNPFSGSTSVSFDVPCGLPYQLSVHAVTGRVVRTIHAGTGDALGTVALTGADLAPGAYVVRLSCGEASCERRVIKLD
jgi:hypothetical protein